MPSGAPRQLLSGLTATVFPLALCRVGTGIPVAGVKTRAIRQAVSFLKSAVSLCGFLASVFGFRGIAQDRGCQFSIAVNKEQIPGGFPVRLFMRFDSNCVPLVVEQGRGWHPSYRHRRATHTPSSFPREISVSFTCFNSSCSPLDIVQGRGRHPTFAMNKKHASSGLLLRLLDVVR